MPKIKILVENDWINDPKLVEDFCKRLQDCLDSPAEFDREPARGVLKTVQQTHRYNMRMRWYLLRLEDHVEVSTDPNNFWNTGGAMGGMDCYGSVAND